MKSDHYLRVIDGDSCSAAPIYQHHRKRQGGNRTVTTVGSEGVVFFKRAATTIKFQGFYIQYGERKNYLIIMNIF